MAHRNLPRAPAELNANVCGAMIKNGAPNYIVAKFFHEVAVKCVESDIDIFKTLPEVPMTRANKLAARFVYEFLKKRKMSLALNVVEKEAKNPLFSPDNKISIKYLDITSTRPPIQKLIRQRYVRSESGSGKLVGGWYKIDSDVTETRSESYHEDPAYVLPPGITKDLTGGSKSYQASVKRSKHHGHQREKLSVSTLSIHSANILTRRSRGYTDRYASDSSTYTYGSSRSSKSSRSSRSRKHNARSDGRRSKRGRHHHHRGASRSEGSRHRRHKRKEYSYEYY